jgi:hypothetical protein
MNERIKMLAVQAGFNIHNDVIDGQNFNHEITKFAELIIKECVMFIDTGANKFSDGEWLRSSVKDIGVMITQNFEVDEC